VDRQAFVEKRVHTYYWEHDWNCAVTTLRILSEVFDIAVGEQVLDAALGMHGAGEYGAQCGLVEGGLMFLGIAGKAKDLPDQVVVTACRDYAEAFEALFGSLLCRELRPEGFQPGNPDHLCERLTCDAVRFDIRFVTDLLADWEDG